MLHKTIEDMSYNFTQEQKKYHKFLEDLMASGETDKFSTAPYLQEEYGLTESLAVEVTSQWLANYNK
tara:strand:- start:46381 stop:46581 length:201 start_codon:yes stop_codon:yes gene_type:complete